METGSAFAEQVTLTHSYNDRNELTATDHQLGNPPTTQPALAWDYAYDAIGNRTTAGLVDSREDPEYPHTEDAAYAAFTNNVNQYGRVTIGLPEEGIATAQYVFDADGNLSIAWVAGDMNCDGMVNNFDIDAFSLAVASAGDTPPFGDYLAEYPNCNPLNADCNGDGSVNNFDIDYFAGLIGNSALHMKYVWDGENRLIRVEPNMADPPVDAAKVEFVYDYMGRRVEKKVSTYIWRSLR